MKLIYDETGAGDYYVCEDPTFNDVPVEIPCGRGATIEEAKNDYFKKCRDYADGLIAKARAIYMATDERLSPTEMRKEI